jgi:tetratricopeptide (TPR) repeat protein
MTRFLLVPGSLAHRSLLALLATGSIVAQHPAPAGETGSLRELLEVGGQALRQEDPTTAWDAFRSVRALDKGQVEGLLGLGQAHLMMGRAETSQAYAEAVMRLDHEAQEAMSLLVRSRIRARQFELAARSAEGFCARVQDPSAALLASLGSALFRVQRTEEAASAYLQVVARDPRNAEAHLRLGSGLSAPRHVEIDDELAAVVGQLRQREFAAATARLRSLLAHDPGNPVLHRLLGEALYQEKAEASMANNDAAYRRLSIALPRPVVDRRKLARFIPAYPTLTGSRRLVVERAASLFSSRLDKLLTVGARHDLLLEVDRTTDAPGRSSLRGKRTFDGRVWDDVRGIGGLKAATGIEALDDAAQFGFDTLAHEIAHQVHYYAIPYRDRVRIRQLYKSAMAAGRCLDYYAASNEAEYFGQGVEAFACLAKRPGGETTHGHTRFELMRVDPELHELIADLVDNDPLRGEGREALLEAACEVALRCGRPIDAWTAAEMMSPGSSREGLLARARRAMDLATSR